MNRPAPVAIVGIGGIFPAAPDLAAFWHNVAAGVDASRQVPEGRWALPVDSAFDPVRGRPDKVYSRRGCFIEDFDLDLTGLTIDRRFAESLDGHIDWSA